MAALFVPPCSSDIFGEIQKPPTLRLECRGGIQKTAHRVSGLVVRHFGICVFNCGVTVPGRGLTSQMGG